jgi:putative ABC transport system permease protein
MSSAAGRLRAVWSGFTGTGAAASLGLALLVLACTFIGIALPRASLDHRTQALHQLLSRAGPLGRTVTGTSGGFAAASPASYVPLLVSDLTAQGGWIRAQLGYSGLRLAPARTGWSGLTAAARPVQGSLASAQLELAYRDTLPQNSRLTAGALPGRAALAGRRARLGIAVTQATAAVLRLRVGSALTMRSHLTQTGRPVLITLTVTGIVRPASRTAAFWTADSYLAGPAAGGIGGAFIGPAELGVLQAVFAPDDTEVTLGFPLALGQVTANQAAALQGDLIRAVTVAQARNAYLSTPLIDQLASFVSADDAVSSVLSLLFVSLAAIGLIVILLGARLLSEYRTAEFTVLRARGASLPQLAWLALRGGALVVIPAAVLAVAAATALTPGPPVPLAWQLAGVTLAVALAGPPVITFLRHRSPRGRRRGRPGTAPAPRFPAARRWILDIALACAAAGSLLILRELGAPPAGEVNFYTSAAPALVALPVAVLIMRLYPVALRSLLRLAGRRRGVTAFVGLARSARTGLSSALPVFALVLALGLIAFGATLHATIDRGEVLASWQTTGADAVIQAPPGSALTPGLQRAVAAVPGVQRTAAAALITAASPNDLSLPVIDVSPARYGALVAGTSAPAFPAAALRRPASGAMVPILVSPGAQSLLAGGQITTGGRTLHVRVAGQAADLAGLGAGGAFVVVPSWALPPETPDVLAVIGAHLDGPALAAVVRRAGQPSPALVLRASVLRSLADAPLPRAGYLAFTRGTAAAAGFCVLIVLLSLVLGARSRELTLARLATMGLSPGQARRLGIIETVPAIVAAAAGGIACALLLVPLLAPAISLAAFTRSGASVPVRADPGALAATAAALLALAFLTMIIQAALASRRGTARALRVGE